MTDSKKSNFMIMTFEHGDGVYADGFHMTFKNGLTISVRFGNNNYCDNQNHAVGLFDVTTPKWQCMKAGGKLLRCPNAEIAIWKSSDGYVWNGGSVNNRIWMTHIVLADGGINGEPSVIPYCTSDELAEIISKTANWKPEK